jgi:hypothetical protein
MAVGIVNRNMFARVKESAVRALRHSRTAARHGPKAAS